MARTKLGLRTRNLPGLRDRDSTGALLCLPPIELAKHEQKLTEKIPNSATASVDKVPHYELFKDGVKGWVKEYPFPGLDVAFGKSDEFRHFAHKGLSSILHSALWQSWLGRCCVRRGRASGHRPGRERRREGGVCTKWKTEHEGIPNSWQTNTQPGGPWLDTPPLGVILGMLDPGWTQSPLVAIGACSVPALYLETSSKKTTFCSSEMSKHSKKATRVPGHTFSCHSGFLTVKEVVL